MSGRFKIFRITGFSLLELLVVMGLIAILAAITLPAFSTIATGRSLETAGDGIINSMAIARQTALTMGHRTRWELASLPAQGYRVHRVVGFEEDGWKQLSPWKALPVQIRLDPEPARTSIVATKADITYRGTTLSDVEVLAVEFRPDGTSSLAADARPFLTISPAAQDSNWMCIAINPVTGRATSYRP